MTEAQTGILNRYTTAIRLHLEGVLQGRESELNPLKKLIDCWEGDLKNGGSGQARLTLEQIAGALSPIFETRARLLGNLRGYISRARKAIKKAPLITGGYRFAFDISTDVYGLDVVCETQKNKNLLRFWAPYMESDKSAAIALVERLFFHLNRDVYVRNVRVNNVADYKQCPVLKRLIKSPRPSNLYVSTGEAGAAFTMLDTFSNKLEIAANGMLFSPGVRYPNNLVVMGSGTEEPRFDPPERFRYRITRDGVANKLGKIRYRDIWGEQKLVIHVLVSRWRNDDGYAVTTVHASHGRAIEGVCQYFSDENNVAELLTKNFSPLAMQMVFKTVLQREGAVNRSNDVKCLWQSPY